MKKNISFILALLLLATMITLPTSAATSGTNYGEVKKVGDGDIDMSRADMTEAAWANATKVNLNSTDNDEAYGDVYLLWSNTALYAVFDITDNTPDTEDSGKAQNNAPWEEDSVEWFIDIANGGEHSEQFRVDRFGVPSYYPQNGAWMDDFYIGSTKISDCEPVPSGHMSWVVKVDGNKYYIKMKITFFGNVSAGAVGMNFQINNNGGSSVWATGYEGSSWDVDMYGYMTLVNEPAYVAPEVVKENPPVEEEAPAPVAEETPAVTNLPLAPQTGDAGIISLIAVMFVTGFIMFKKRIFVK